MTDHSNALREGPGDASHSQATRGFHLATDPSSPKGPVSHSSGPADIQAVTQAVTDRVTENLQRILDSVLARTTAHGPGTTIAAECPRATKATEVGRTRHGQDSDAGQLPTIGRGRSRKKSRRCDTSSSDRESEDELRSIGSLIGHRNRPRDHGTKLPPFTGKEPWEIWYNRFVDVAQRHGWNEDDKLDELLPRLQGQAGEFVFGQLSRRTRQSFGDLARELKNRFRRVETARTFQAKFSNRDKKWEKLLRTTLLS